MKTTFIYALKHPKTGELRYIGKANNTAQRLREHVSHSRRGTNHRTCWVRSLLKSGLLPVLEILDEVPEHEWPSWEVAYIDFFRSSGCNLVNSTPGGECGPGLTGENHPFFGRTGNKHPGFGRPGPNRGIPQTPETIAKKISAMRGQKRTLETRQKQSVSARLAKARRHQEYVLAQLWR